MKIKRKARRESRVKIKRKAPPTNERGILAPEGIELTFQVATGGDRVTAFFIDLVFIALIILVVGFLASYAIGATFGRNQSGTQLVGAIVLLVFFFLRNFYFMILEMRWGGATIGKRMTGIRVISREGGPVAADSIISRNLMRELEFYLPIGVVFSGKSFLPVGQGWEWLLGSAWLLVFLIFPFLGKNRLRCGDLVAGTIVVRMPRARLLPDLAQTVRRSRSEIQKRRERKAQGVSPERYVFTPEQLDIYGIHELQVLEDILRRKNDLADPTVLHTVCAKIRRKIRWPAQEEVETLAFLDAFYRAQRARLEQRMLFGDRRERKKR